jgi:hypothetical protein
MKTHYITSLNMGTLAGLISFGLYMGLYTIGLSPMLNWRYLGIWIPILFIFLAIRSVKKNIPAGEMNFQRAFYTGFTTSFVMSSLKGILVYLTIMWTGEGIIDQYFDQLNTLLNEAKKRGETIPLLPANYEDFRNQLNATSVGMMEFNMQLIGGAILSVILAFIMKSPKKKVSNTENEITS